MTISRVSDSHILTSCLITGIERSQIVSKVNYTRFALCFDSDAAQLNPLTLGGGPAGGTVQ